MDSSDRGLAPADRDAMIRTVLAEAGSQDPDGWGAVASVIRNRLAAGNYGSTPAAVVTAPNQFEVWSNNRAQQVDPSSPQYQAAGRVVDAVAAGAPDITGGATHFFSPSGQQALGRANPSWGQGQPLASIGGQLFFAPDGPVKSSVAANSNPSPQSKATPQMRGQPNGMGPNVDGLAKMWTGQGASDPSTAPSSVDQQAGPDVDGLTKMWGNPPASTPGATDTAPPLTVHGPAGALTAAPDDSSAGSIAKNVATGAIKGVGDAAGVFGNTNSLSEYLIARAESAITGKPLAQVQAEHAAIMAKNDQNPSVLHQLVMATSPDNLPTGADVSSRILGATGEYVPTSEPGKMLQAGVQTVVGAMGPGVRGTSAVGPATAATVASPGLSGTLAQAAAQAPMAGTSGGIGQFATDTTNDPLVGMAAGAAPGVLLGAGGAIANRLTGTVEPATAALADAARNKFGIPIGVGQISESPAVRFTNSVVNKLPLSGAGPAAADQQTAFNRAVSGTFGENADKITPDIMAAAKTRLGNEFDRIGGQSSIRLDQQLGQDLVKTAQDAQQVLPAAEAKPINAQIGNVVDAISKNGGVIPGDTYQALTRKGSPLDRAMNSSDSNVKYYAGQVRNALDDALERSAPPELVQDLRTARGQYKAMKTVEDLVEKSPTGNISPASLLQPVRNSYGTMAYGGGGDLADLSRIGQRFMKEPPSSGTAERLGVMSLLGQLGTAGASFASGNPLPIMAAAGSIPATLAAGRFIRSYLGSDAATNRLISASLGQQTQPGLGNALMSTAGVPAVLDAGSRIVKKR